MKERMKEAAFFIAAFAIIVWLLSFLAPSSETASPQPQMAFPVFTATDWIMAFVAIGAIPAAVLTVYVLQMRSIAQQLQVETGPEEPEVAEPRAPATERPIIYRNSTATPEIVLRLCQERDELQRELQALRVEHALLQARQSIPEPTVEPERELTYRAVVALLRAGNVGIKEAIRIVRDNGGMVGRKGYSELSDLLPLLSPIASVSPVSSDSQTVNCEPRGANQEREPVNQRATGRSQLRRRGRGR